MTIMKWFRKRSKKLMIWIGCLLMIGFLIPQIAGRSGSSYRDQIIGYYTDSQGKEHEITSMTLRVAAHDLEILREIGTAQLSNPMISILSNIADLGGVNPYAEMAAFQLFFADTPTSNSFRQFLLQQTRQGGWAMNEEQAVAIEKNINQLTTSERSGAHRYYLLLLHEAQQAGLQSSSQQVSAFLNVRTQLMGAGQVRIAPIAYVTKRLKVTEKQIKRAIGNYISIVQYVDTITGELTLSEQEIKSAIREMMEMESVAGAYTSFSANLFLKQVTDPSTEEMQQHFDTYKAFMPGESKEDENPFGFGYKLFDRVQVDVLHIDLSQAQKVVEDEFVQEPIEQQEDEIQTYWAEHRDEFIETIPAPQDDPEAQPETRQKEFDEVVPQARQALMKSLALQKARKRLAEARNALTKIGDQSLSDELRTALAGEYQAQAERLSTEALEVKYDQSPFLSAQAAQNYLDFGRTYSAPRNLPDQSLINLLFDSEPFLGEEDVITPDNPPVKLYETIDSLLSYGYGNNIASALLVRIVATDGERVPESMTDDGALGPFDAQRTVASEGNRLYELIKSDVKQQRAFELAKKQAEVFAAQATGDWTIAYQETNQSLIINPDPNDPNQPGPLRESSLAENRATIDRMREYAAQQNQQNPYLYQTIARQSRVLADAAKVARQRTDGASVLGLAILEQPEDFNVLVFKDLSVTPASLNDYIQRRPLISNQLLTLRQAPSILAHFNPKNIEKRNKFRFEEFPEEEELAQEASTQESEPQS